MTSSSAQGRGRAHPAPGALIQPPWEPVPGPAVSHGARSRHPPRRVGAELPGPPHRLAQLGAGTSALGTGTAGHCALPRSGKPSSCGLLGWPGVCSEGCHGPNPFPCSCSAPGRAAQRPGEPLPCPGGAASRWDCALSSCHPTAWPCSRLAPTPRCVWTRQQSRKRSWGKWSSIPGEKGQA